MPLTIVAIEEKPDMREGIEFKFRGQDEDENGDPVSEFVSIVLIVPPLNLKSMQTMEDRLHTLNGAATVESMKTMVDALAAALKRNYRGIPRWLIEQTIDVGNIPSLTEAFMDLGGLHRKAIEEKKAQAAATAAQTGTGSTPT